MTTTVKALGGGAHPASIDTSGKVTGGPALRVYGFDSEAAAEAAGYVCEGGPAMSVALITDAQIASGEWKAEGDPSALVVYTAPSNMPIEGGLSVPVYPVNGWGSAPAPVGPQFDSAEVGTVNASTVVVTFDQDVSAADYSAGVTIKVNGSGATISSATRQSNHAIVYYALSAAVVFGDVVTWEYASGSGSIIAEDDSTPLGNVSAQSVTNNAADTIGDGLRADMIAYYKFNSNSVDATGRGNDLTNSGSVAFQSGKVGNAATFSNTSGQALSIANNADWSTDAQTKSWAIAGWVKLGSSSAYAQYDVIIKYDQNEAGPEINLYYAVSAAQWEAGSTALVFYSMAFDQNWHFFVLYSRQGVAEAPYENRVGFSIDNAPFQTQDIFASVNQNIPVYFGTDQFDTISHIQIDEIAYIKRLNPVSPTVLTQDEIDYLYNSGAGRTLYP